MALPPGASLRRARIADLDAIMSLETSVFVTDAWPEAAMRAELLARHSYYLVAEREGRVVGYAGLRAVPGGTDADVQTIAVAPDARRHGIGRALMDAMIGEARRRGAGELFLEVRADNPHAQALYRSLGFEPLAVRRHYYQPDDVDAIVMRLTLPSAPPPDPVTPSVEPVASPVEPVETAGPSVPSVEPVASPVEPVETVGPSVPSVEPVASPVEPVETVGPSVPSVEPVETAGSSVSSVEPVTPSVEPVETAGSSVSSVEPVTPLVEPVETAGPSVSSVEPVASPVEPVETVDPSRGFRQAQPAGARQARPAGTEQARPAVEPLVIGIETSCDETGIGIVRGTRLLANVIASSMDEHARYGGVVPEVAARAHLEALEPTITEAVSRAGIRLSEVDAVAVTSGPGLAGALMVGVGAAKALAVALDRPLYGVNHLVGHVGADLLDPDGGPGRRIELPTIALLVSGGHTSLLHVRSLTDDVELLGETIDDAAGEAFDKVARVLGLPYPGGPQIDAAAVGGDPNAIRFPRGLTRPRDMERHRYDFSFSGLKTAVARWVEQREDAGEAVPVADVAASFREAVADVLLRKALAACADLHVPRLLLGGGVVANARVRQLAAERAEAAGVALRIPALSLCTDNGAMIAALAAQRIVAGHPPSGLGFGADSTLPVTVVQV